MQAQGPVSEGSKCSGVGLVPEGKKAFLRLRVACRRGGPLLYKEMLCSDFSESPSWHPGEVASGRSWPVGPLQRFLPLAIPSTVLIGAIVPCPLCGARVLGAKGRVGSSQPLLSQSSVQ